MGIGASVFLLALGAILAFAVDASLSGVSLFAVGVILMVAGGVGLVVAAVAHSRTTDRVVTERRP